MGQKPKVWSRYCTDIFEVKLYSFCKHSGKVWISIVQLIHNLETCSFRVLQTFWEVEYRKPCCRLPVPEEFLTFCSGSSIWSRFLAMVSCVTKPPESPLLRIFNDAIYGKRMETHIYPLIHHPKVSFLSGPHHSKLSVLPVSPLPKTEYSLRSPSPKTECSPWARNWVLSLVSYHSKLGAVPGVPTSFFLGLLRLTSIKLTSIEE